MEQMTNIDTSTKREEGDEALPKQMPSHPGHPELGTSSGYNLAWLAREEEIPIHGSSFRVTKTSLTRMNVTYSVWASRNKEQ